ncbi:MAG TPA: prepilin-type N-terminal cleavage/methylation domain-containing protein [Candidatus Wallbacteria bacterium]|nr:prepilin-type N-terminal cleavage/methylation domain-containing protein [Candidatus Wallbacteria bacterium]
MNIINEFICQKKNATTKGFSLIEIIVTVIILAVSIIPLLTTLFEHYKATADIVNKVVAANYAKDVIDYIKSQPYNILNQSLNETEIGGTNSSKNFSSLPPLAKGFKREVSIEEFKDEPLAPDTNDKINYKVIRVTVTFDDPSGSRKASDKISLMGTIMMDKITR